MAERRRTARLPEPSKLMDRAAEAAGDAGDLGAELVSTGVDAVTSLLGGLASAPEQDAPPRRRGVRGSGGTATSTTVKRAALTMARENRKTAKTEAAAAKQMAGRARKTARTAAKSTARVASAATRSTKSNSTKKSSKGAKSSSRAKKK